MTCQLRLLKTYFFFVGQFWACNGSSGPSNSTTYSSWLGNSGGYGFPRPISGSGLRLSRLLPVIVRPTVPACWLFEVWTLSSTVGWRSKSRWVEIRLIVWSRRAAEVSVPDDEVLEAVKMRSISWLGRVFRPEAASVSFLLMARSSEFMVTINRWCNW